MMGNVVPAVGLAANTGKRNLSETSSLPMACYTVACVRTFSLPNKNENR